jgi:hypothetical protein
MLERFPRFFKNSGTVGSIQLLVFAVLLFFAMKRDFGSGVWVITLPVFIGSLFITYPFRDWLIENYPTVHKVMNGIAITGLIIYFFFRPEEETNLIRIVFCFFIGTYIGTFFWILSDENVQRI